MLAHGSAVRAGNYGAHGTYLIYQISVQNLLMGVLFGLKTFVAHGNTSDVFKIGCWQALCTEASLRAMRRAYPQIYDSDEKLLIDPARVCVTRRDFLAAFSAMTPASHRSAAAHARSGPLYPS